MASSISMYSALMAFGYEGYQKLLAQFLEVNLHFREQLSRQIPEADIVNPDNCGMSTLFRIYPEGAHDLKTKFREHAPLKSWKETMRLLKNYLKSSEQKGTRCFLAIRKNTCL